MVAFLLTVVLVTAVTQVQLGACMLLHLHIVLKRHESVWVEAQPHVSKLPPSLNVSAPLPYLVTRRNE